MLTQTTAICNNLYRKRHIMQSRLYLWYLKRGRLLTRTPPVAMNVF